MESLSSKNISLAQETLSKIQEIAIINQRFDSSGRPSQRYLGGNEQI
jgi:hypothetical protein